jgi:hypothetical protein
MGYTRVYSTLAYLTAILLGLLLFQPGVAPPPGAFGDPLVQPLAQTPDPRGL